MFLRFLLSAIVAILILPFVVSKNGAATGLLTPAMAMQGIERPVLSLSFNGTEFINHFNNATDRTRLVMVFSPT